MTLKTVFGVDDLSDYAREVAGKDPVVVPLSRETWVDAGAYKVFLRDVFLEDNVFGVKVLAGRYKGYSIDEELERDPVIVKDCHLIPHTNLILDVWRDRSRNDTVVPLLVQKGPGATVIEDFMGIATDLPGSVMEKVAKAIITKKVDWEESKTSLVAEACGGEFVFEGCRYSFDEVFEFPSGLFLREGSPDYINSLLEVLENERLSLLDKHQYSKAKKIHEKMESLRSVLQKV